MAGTTPVIGFGGVPGGHFLVHEAGLPTGTKAGQVNSAASFSFTIRAEDGIDDLSIGGYAAIRDGVFTAGAIDEGYGRLLIQSYDPSTAYVTVRFEMTGAHQSYPGGQLKYGDFAMWNVALTDRDGDSAGASLTLQIRDDEPVTASPDSLSVNPGAAAGGNVVTNDRFTADGFGGLFKIVDGAGARPAVSVPASGTATFQGAYGTLTIEASGAFTYAARSDAPAGSVDPFAYWVKDGDGDEDSDVLSVTIGQASSPPGSSDEGRVINSPGPDATVSGGAGNDTINGSQGADMLTGGAGADTFAWAREPWAPAKVTDFVVGTDRIDFSALFSASGYSGADPVADKYIRLQAGDGGTQILFDRDGTAAAQQWPNYVVLLQGVSPLNLTWSQLTTPGAGPPPTGSQANLLPSSAGRPEGNPDQSFPTVYSFSVERSGDYSQGAAVDWRVIASGADPASGADFEGGVLPTGTLTFNPGQQVNTVSLHITRDTLYEPDESFTFALTAARGGVNLGPTREAVGVIRNDDANPAPSDGRVYDSPGPGSTMIGGSGADTFNASQGPDVITGGGGADVFSWSQGPWQYARVTDFMVGTDRLDFSRLLQAAGYTGSDPVADKYISIVSQGQAGTSVTFDSDGVGQGQPWPTNVVLLERVPTQGLTWTQLSQGGGSGPGAQIALSGGSREFLEGNSGFTSHYWTVSRIGDTSGTSTASWAVNGRGSNPAAESDFSGGALPGGTLTFGPGETSKTIDVRVAGDTAVEPDEGFNVVLTGVTGASLGSSTASTGLIRNDDSGPGPTVGWSSGPISQTEGDSGTTAYAFVATRTGPTEQPLGLGWVVEQVSAAGAATTADDFATSPLSGTFTIPAGQASATLTVLVGGDTIPEADEGFRVRLQSGTATVTEQFVHGTVRNDDEAAPPGQEGRVLTASRAGDTLTGGSGNDTLNASQGQDMLTGQAGADHFVFGKEPWAPGHITDFQPGVDRIDIRGMLDAAGYSGSDPFGAGYLSLTPDGNGGTKVLFDRDAGGPTPQWPNYWLNIDRVDPTAITQGDWIFQ